MKTRTIYVAFDDEEFDTEEECREYEEEKNSYLEEFVSAYSLFDKNMKPYTFQRKELEDSVITLEDAIGCCEYVHVKQVPSKEALDFLEEHVAYVLPPQEIGWYRWDYNSSDWVSK